MDTLNLRRATGSIEHFAERAGDRLYRKLRKRPYLGVTLAGAAGIALASAVGVGELAIGCAAAYATYLMLAKHEPPSQALRDAAQLEKELV